MYKLAILFGCIVLALPCAGGTVSVNWDGSGDYTTIQGGIDAANHGDTVIVAEGTYVENISFGGKNIVLRSTDPDDPVVVAGTIIAGTGAGAVVTFYGVETTSCELIGFTIRGGYNIEHGGGIEGNGTYASISRCMITGNTTEKAGGGFWAFNGDIVNCKIIGNFAGGVGGGLVGCHGRIENCVVSGNTAIETGGGLNNCDGDIVNCTIARNTASDGSGVWGCNGSITNCIFWNNSAGVRVSESSVPTHSRYLGAGGTTGLGNITDEPEFAFDGDYYLLIGSPCIDTGTNSPPGGSAATDIEGQVRIFDGNGDGVAVADMGAYEFPSTVIPILYVLPNKLRFYVPQGGPNPAAKVLYIQKTTDEIFNWAIVEDCPWLSVNLYGGQISVEIVEVMVSVDMSGLDAGNYSCALEILCPGTVNGPQIIEVIFGIAPDDGNFWVPHVYPTIQAGIDAAGPGDTVIVGDGRYTGEGNRDIDFGGKGITVCSENGAENCVIDCQGREEEPYRGFIFHSNESDDSVLCGFTITGGYAPDDDFVLYLSVGGGIYCVGSSPIIKNCIIMDNNAGIGDGLGGGIFCYESGAVITDCIIRDNNAEWGGGGVCEESNVMMTNCIIAGNNATLDGGIIFSENEDLAIVSNCTITQNKGGGLEYYNSRGVIVNSIIWGNESFGIRVDNGPSPTVRYSDVQGGWSGKGNIKAGPLFSGGGDYHLQADSPCIDRGTNSPAGGLKSTDFDGSARPLDGDYDGIATADMGVYEFLPQGPYMFLNSDSFDFYGLEAGANPEDKILSIRNTGTGSFSWEISGDCDWLEVLPRSGETSIETDEVVLSVDTAGLAGGSYTCELEILGDSAINGPQIVEVSLFVKGPEIVLSESEIGFSALGGGVNPESQELSISNGGGGTLNWEIIYDCDWLEVLPVNGEITSEVDNVVLSVDIAGLGPGNYDCQLEVSSGQAGNSPQTVEVSLHVGGEFRVPQVYATIQDGIDAAWDGDIVTVSPSVYNENIGFGGKNIILTSTDPDDSVVVAETIIAGTGAGAVVSFAGTEEATCELVGFAITGGYNTKHGGGIQGNGAYAHIAKCVITGNTTERAGGGVWFVNGDIINCKIIGNSGKNGGGLVGCHGRIENCVVSGNTAIETGGGMNNSDGEIVNCTIANNRGSDGGGVRDCDGTITNCIIWGNSEPEIYNSAGLTYSCFVGGSDNGNIDMEPLFALEGDYHLLGGSPCLDSGDNSAAGVGGVDIEGNERIVNDTVDMGAYEFNGTAACIAVWPQEVDFFVAGGHSIPLSQTVLVRNSSVGTLNWEISGVCEWLEVLPVSGDSSTEIDEITVRFSGVGMAVGNYKCVVVISSDEAINNGQAVTVSLRVGNQFRVPEDYGTIQEAIDAARDDDDIVTVRPGIYHEDIYFEGKHIIVTSIDPDDPTVVAGTVIEGTGAGAVVTFYGEGTSCELVGFTIRGGYNTEHGGGIEGNGTYASISRCVITGNTAEKAGGGFWAFNGDIINCKIIGNSAGGVGGGLAGCNGRIENCVVGGNTAIKTGGGLNNCDGDIVNCTIAQNTASDGSGVWGCNGSIANCIFWNNGTGSRVSASSVPIHSRYLGAGGTTGLGNITDEPEFALDGDYHLLAGSPCIDSGDNSAVGWDGVDIEGNERIVNGTVDMGAYEFNGDAACIVVWSKEVEFFAAGGHSYPSSQTVLIRNSGGETLYWEISEDCEWLEVMPLSGVLTDEIGSIVLTVDTSGVDIDEYSCVMTVFDGGAVNSPQAIRVTLRPSIQIAIDNADDGDTVVIPAGVYKENINFGGKNIVLKSSNPDDWGVVGGTVIEGTGAGAVVTFDGTETGSCKLAGFTITGGNSTVGGGGVRGNGTQANIANCVITGNTTELSGGGFWVFNGDIINCKIIGNSAGDVGGGLAGCQGRIENCVVSDNTAIEIGGGLNNCDGDIINCTVTRNMAASGSGVSGCNGTIINCIIWDNSKTGQLKENSVPAYSCYIGANSTTGLGNIKAEPEFADAGNGDYHLRAWSPCIDGGDNSVVEASGDLDGGVRVFDGDGDGEAIVDMGAYEFPHYSEPYISANPGRIDFRKFENEAGPEEQLLGVYNEGMGSFGWEIEEDCEWLETWPMSGEVGRGFDEVVLSADSDGFGFGSYYCQLHVVSDEAVNSSFVVEVALHVYPEGALVVPIKYETIQSAIDAAVDGDVVSVADGVYIGVGNRDINFGGKAITVRSENGPEYCIIDCRGGSSGYHSGFYFHNEESNDSVVDGFTITGANNSGIMCGMEYNNPGGNPTIRNCIIKGNSNSQYRAGGGGISCHNGSSPVITDCVIKNNSAATNMWWVSGGGGIYCEESDMTIANCVIQDNSVSGNEGELSGGGIFSWSSNLIISNCLIAGNACGGGSPWNIDPFNGGGVCCTGSSVSIVNSTIVDNSADGMGGGVYCYSSDVSISNSILWGNSATEGSELAIICYGNIIIPWDNNGWPATYVSYSDIRGGQSEIYVGDDCVLEWGEGNIDVEPLFADASNGDYHLAFESPCVDIGDNSFVGDGDTDLDGFGRIFDGDDDGIWTVDMGAYEVWPSDVPYLVVSRHEFVFHGFQDQVNPPEQILEVRNFGTGSFGWEISFDCEWLEVWPVSGELGAGGLDEIRLGVDVSGLAVGNYECVLTVSGGQVENSPQVIRVTLQPSIQIAIDNANDGDTVVIPEGVYKENINFGGKNIVLKSSNPDDWGIVAGTVIDGSVGTGAVVTFTGTETGSCKLTGFTITGGYSTEHGGGIQGNGAYANIAKCVITGNTTERAGGGFWFFNGDISNCKIIGNSANYGGGLAGCQGRIENCLVRDNTAIETGGGLNNCDGDIVNCTIAWNTASDGSGVWGCNGNITNCIFWNNSAGARVSASSVPTHSRYLGAGGTTGLGNISANPEFVDAGNGDYRLGAWSPCIDGGDNSVVEAGGDLDGGVRVFDGDGDGEAIVDMGAYEYRPPNTAPVADAGLDKIAYAGPGGTAAVELDGSGSYDTDGDDLTYLWTWEIVGQVYDANGVNPVIELGVGVHEITLVVNDGMEDSEPNEVVVTVVGPVEVDVHVIPQVLSRRNRGRYVLAVMQLPDGVGRDDIDASYGFVLEPGGIDATFWRVQGKREKSIVFAMFDRARLIDATEGASKRAGGRSDVEVSVAGKLISGGYIYGVDVIRIIKPGQGPRPGVRHIRRGRPSK